MSFAVMGLMNYCSESIKYSSHPLNNKANITVSEGENKGRSNAHYTSCLSKIEDPKTSVCVEHKKSNEIETLHGQIESGFVN